MNFTNPSAFSPPGLLPELKVAPGLRTSPIDGGRINDFHLVVDDPNYFDVFALKIVRILHDQWQCLLGLDACWNIPIWTEHHFRHDIAENRGAILLGSHDNAHFYGHRFV